MQHLVLYTVCSYCNIHVQAGACIPVASVSPIHVPLVQRVLKHCGAHKHTHTHTYRLYNIYYSMAESVIWQDIAQVGKVFSRAEGK